jgi:hypothetical protein
MFLFQPLEGGNKTDETCWEKVEMKTQSNKTKYCAFLCLILLFLYVVYLYKNFV